MYVAPMRHTCDVFAKGQRLQYNQRAPTQPSKWLRLTCEVGLKLGSEDPTSPLTTPSTSPCKRIFTKMSPDPVPSGSKGKAKAVIEEESAGEEDDEVEVEPEAEEDDEEEVAVKPTQGRPRKAILLDAAKRLKKL
ncbi:hypothetical protein PtA15_9A439 [Puccinia triticina]|uniref:Uncharacterized protein n=1 Tax=Puccinia triticina TaxID=208348 RepID=A0ABY7CV41_9BASI|nr:uncharacterized protein PtA15_9A439 [Puccinia triticina]WAQ88312.1 hypothetical protein PtA15_9A439 [Puccinia triticina]